MPYTKWVANWGSAPSIAAPHAARYAKDVTLRYILRMQTTGDAVRLHLSNLGGKSAVCIEEAWVANMKDDAAADTATMRRVTFSGQPQCRMDVGEMTVSDEIPLDVVRGGDIAVSLYLRDMTEMASGTDVTGPLSRFWFAEGNWAQAEALPVMHAMTHATVFFLDTVDVRTSEECRCVVCYGDSITAQSWPDFLTLRGLEENWENRAVIRRGIGGSRVLRQYENLQHRHYGFRGHDRFEREVSAAGADSVIILHGVNDIIHPDGVNPMRPMTDLPTADELIEGLRWYIRKGHELGLKVYLATIMTIIGWPSATLPKEEIRQTVNAWIRSTDEIDGYVEFDGATRDPHKPAERAPEHDSGDHLHPSLNGAKAMAACVPLLD